MNKDSQVVLVDTLKQFQLVSEVRTPRRTSPSDIFVIS